MTIIDQQIELFRKQFCWDEFVSEGNTKKSLYTNRDQTEAIEAFLKESMSLVEKAYGGCHNCYGKGYSTVRQGSIVHADFDGDKTYIQEPTVQMNYCSCDRGKQLAALHEKGAESK